MKSNICVLEGKEPNIEKVINEVEMVAVYNQLPRKQSIQLQLLAEEMIGLQKGILGFSKGEFYIENEGSEYRLCLHADIKVDPMTQERFVEMSTEQKNAAYKGFMGKIRLVSDALMNDPTGGAVNYFENCNACGNMMCINPASEYERMWALSQYRENVEANTTEWDELEKSIVANIADDVIIGARSNYIEMVVVKNF